MRATPFSPLVQALALPLLLGGPARAAAPPFTFEELVRLGRIESMEASRDGRLLCLQRATPDLEKNTLGKSLWLVELPGGAARPLTFQRRPDSRDSACRFSPDGRRVVFLSNRDGAPQLYLLELAGGEARRLTDLPGGVGDPLFAPDGRSVLVTAAVFPDCPPLPEGDACNRKRGTEREGSPVKARVMERLFYRHWDSWFDGRRDHLLRVPLPAPGALATVGTAAAPLPAPTDLTPGDADVPAVARAGAGPFALSPDGAELAYVQNLDRELSTSTNNDLLLLPLSGDPRKARPRNLTKENRATDTTPRYSPDGRYLAYLAQRRPGFEADRSVLFLYDRKSGQRRALTESLDAHAGEPVWSADSRRLYFTTSLRARPRIYLVEVKDGGAAAAPVEVAEAGGKDLAVVPGALLYRGGSLSRPDDVYRLPLNGEGRAAGPPQVVTDAGAALGKYALGKVSELWTKTKEGQPLQGWLVQPADMNQQPGRRYPAVVLLHGGPQGAWEDDWFYRWNAQAYAGAGYVVLMPNPRGSEGFGQRFIDEVSGSWGGRPYDDVLRLVDELVALPYVDRQRVGALGASYGGYLANWIATHSDRFAALVSHDGVYDLRSMHGETEELWFPRWEFSGDPWESDQYDRWSPSRFAGNLKTPMLVITNERDFRVPVGQGMQLFTALQLRRVPSKMLIFPDENHWVLKPGNSRLWYATVLDWLHRYLGGAKVDPRLLEAAASRAR